MLLSVFNGIVGLYKGQIKLVDELNGIKVVKIYTVYINVIERIPEIIEADPVSEVEPVQSVVSNLTISSTPSEDDQALFETTPMSIDALTSPENLDYLIKI